MDFLNHQLEINSEKSLELLKFGAIYLNKNRQRVPVDIKIGDYIRAHTEPRRFPVREMDWKSFLIFENEDFIVVNKPSGIPTHATVANLFENVIEQMKLTLGIDLFVTNRLDVATNGILLLAKTKKFQTSFNNALRDSLVTKYYSATVENHISHPQHLIHYMKNDFTQPKVMSDTEQEGFLRCELQILDSEQFTSAEGFPLTKVRIHLLTGRTHQIRAQLSRMGHPVVGDKLYGSRSPWNEKEEVSLTSCYLKFRIFEEFEFKL